MALTRACVVVTVSTQLYHDEIHYFAQQHNEPPMCMPTAV